MSIFIPEINEEFYYIGDDAEIWSQNNCGCEQCTHLIKSGNCYRTEADAERAKEKQYAVRELEILADELNNGVEIDWEDILQSKYCIMYDKAIVQWINCVKNAGAIYCLSDKFLETALERLGVDKLKLILNITPPEKEN